MNNVSSVQKKSDEYNQIEHYLSMCSIACGIVSNLIVFRIDNAEITANFDRKTGGLLRLPSWVKEDDLPEDNSLEEICQYGFQLQNTTGMLFTTGNVDVIPSSHPSEIKRLIYCEVAVGRAKVGDPHEVASSTIAPLPQGFDSFYIPHERVDQNNDGELTMEEYDAAANFDFRDPSMYQHQYLIKDGLHVNPRYIVEFEMISSNEEDADMSLTLGSGETPVTENGVGDTSGSESEDAHEFFDPVMYRPVSLAEKLSNANLSRRLIPIDKAFNLAQEEAQKEDSILNKKLGWIELKLSEVDSSVRKVNINYAEQYDEIVQASEKAIAQLQQLSKSKLELLLGVEMELRREKEEIEWTEGFISMKSIKSQQLCEKKHQEYLNFLNAWKSHSILRNGLSRAKPQEINILGNIQPDMIVHSVITVSTKDQLPSAMMSLKEKTKMTSPVTAGTATTTATVAVGKDEDNQSTGASAFNDCLHDTKYFFDALATNSGLYSSLPAKPQDNLISFDAQASVDRNVTKIQLALAAALNDSHSSKRGMPLPPSITRSAVSGTQYHLPDATHFKNAYNEMGNNESYTDEQLQVEMEKKIQHFVKNDNIILHSEAKDETHVAGRPVRTSLADLRPLGEHDTHKHPPRVKAESRESSRKSTPLLSNSLTIFQSTSLRQSAGFLTASEEFDGDLGSYLEQVTEQYRPTYSLKEGATRRHSQLSITNASFQLTEESVFFESEILSPEQAESLYLNLPFFSKPPECSLLYSSQRDGSGLEFMYEALCGVKGPNVLLIQSGDFIFGAYSNQTLLPTGESKWAGSPSCFLFSITLDLKLPYHGRNPPGKGLIDHPCAFSATEELLVFGNGDLLLNALLEAGSSRLEGCFGLGLPKTSHAATTLLAGVCDFAIDKLEVWQVASIV